jgi:crotonobetainyl-CoA:carnitine CoA-transferase CaiB-like acyl-CoA transferase
MTQPAKVSIRRSFAPIARIVIASRRYRSRNGAAISAPPGEEITVTGALSGIRVLDFTRVFAGPAGTQILGDLGADVFKVEEPRTGDEARYFGISPQKPERHGASAPFLALNRNKRSIALDLACPAGRAVALRMAERCDVVVHNFRPGAMVKWGLGYQDVRSVNAGVIYCDFSAYGHTGPLSHIGANDLSLQAHSGLMSITGEPGRPPVRCGTAAIDLNASLALVSAVLAALFHRARTGEGQAVETSLLLSSAHLMSYFYTEYWMDGRVHKAMGTANHLSVPNQTFPSADGSVVIIAPNDAMWRRCATALDAAALDLPQYRAASGRQRHREELVAAIGGVTSQMASSEVVERLGAVKVTVAKVNGIDEAADHAQLAAAGGIVEFDLDGQPTRAVSTPFHLGGTPAQVRRPPPALGGDTDEVLQLSGFDTTEIEAWRAEGAFGPVGV